MTSIPVMVSKRALPEVSRSIQKGIVEKAYSAAACVGSVQGAPLHRQAQGSTAFTPPRQNVDNDTLFDLGDLSMPLGAGLAAMHLVAQHRLDIGAKLGHVLRDFANGPLAAITIDMLLDHTSGLPADAPLALELYKTDRLAHPDQQLLGKRAAVGSFRSMVASLPLVTPPGSQTQVSQIGFMVLGWVIETVAAKPLDAYLTQEIYRPLGIDDEVLFLPTDAKRRLGKVPLIAATGTCPHRHRLIRGEVWDLNAWGLGGVAGHAGLFATASGVWRLAQRLLDCFHAAQGFFHTGTLNRFWTRSQRLQTTRTLGWDTPTVLQSPAGKRMSRTSVGHAGSHGTSLWIDPNTQVIGVLLANADHGTAAQKDIAVQKVQARVYELLAGAAASGPPPPDADEAWQSLMAHNKTR